MVGTNGILENTRTGIDNMHDLAGEIKNLVKKTESIRSDFETEMAKLLCEIQAIMYTLDVSDSTDIKKLRLRLHLISFLYLQYIVLLYGSGLNSLFNHMLVTHVAAEFEIEGFRNSSTESGESLWAIVKRILEQYTNKHMSSALEELFVRLETEDQFRQMFKRRCRKEKSPISEHFFKTHVWRELSVSKSWTQRNQADWDAFCQVIISYGHSWTLNTSGDFIFTTVEATCTLFQSQGHQCNFNTEVFLFDPNIPTTTAPPTSTTTTTGTTIITTNTPILTQKNIQKTTGVFTFRL